MFGDGRQAHLKRLGQLSDGDLAGDKTGQDGAPGGIGKCGKGGAEAIGSHNVLNLEVKYIKGP
jgi:hypothetical protein